MKRIRLILLSTAIVLAAAGAFATHTGRSASQRQILYHRTADGTFIPVGAYGTDYICQPSSDTCTWYFQGGAYHPNSLGTYVEVQ